MSLLRSSSPRLSGSFVASTLCAASLLVTSAAYAVGKQGDVIQTDTVGASLYTYNLDTKTSTNIGDIFNLSEFVGLHAYVVDRVRVGMNLQFTERIHPELPPGKSAFQRFAFLPQVGWNFYDPLFTALVFGVAPRTDGRQHVNLTLQGILGVSLPLAGRFRLTLAGEVPWTYYDKHTLGVTALTGISIRL